MRILDAIVQRTIDSQEALVARPYSARREGARVTAILAVVLFASSAPIWAEPASPIAVVAGLVMAGAAGWGVIAGLRVKLAYRSGWLDGRAQMVRALAESMRRGHTPQEWLEGELVRDYAVLGLDPELALGLDEEAGGES